MCECVQGYTSPCCSRASTPRTVSLWTPSSGCRLHRGHFPGCSMAAGHELNIWPSTLNITTVARRSASLKDGRLEVCCGRNFPMITPWRSSAVKSRKGLAAAGASALHFFGAYRRAGGSLATTQSHTTLRRAFYQRSIPEAAPLARARTDRGDKTAKAHTMNNVCFCRLLHKTGTMLVP